MSEPQDHSVFIAQAKNFKHQLEDAHFTADEVAAMLGNFVLCAYNQQFTTQYPPELYEMLTKSSRAMERELAQEDD